MEMGEQHMGNASKIGPPVRLADFTLALALTLTSIVGMIWNIVAIIFFSRNFAPRNNTLKRDRNKVYFRVIYITICVTDLVICSSVFPVIDALIEDPGYPDFRIPLLFGNEVFCAVWGFLWEILPSFSVFLVGVLSLSRLILLVKPQYKFTLSALFVSMTTYGVVIVTTKIALLLTTDVMDYEPMLRYCFIISHKGVQFRTQEITTVSIMISHLALPVIPVIVGFCSSLILLLSPKHRVANSNSNSAQENAATTVVIITVVYIIFNIPIIINNIFYLHGLNTRPAAKFVDIYSNVVLFYYVWPITYIVSVALNSMANPLIYYFRMQIFKTFVDRRLRLLSLTISNRIRDFSTTSHQTEENV